MSNPVHGLLSESDIASLARRMELLPQLIRRQQEELILRVFHFHLSGLKSSDKLFGDQNPDHVENAWLEPA